MPNIRIRKTIIRLAALGLLLLSALGPWFKDTHPSTPERCDPPLVYYGDQRCACLITLISVYPHFGSEGYAWGVGVPPLLPFLSTALLLLGRDRRILWVFHLAVWFLLAVEALFFFSINLRWIQYLILWGAGLGGTLAVLLLVWEMRTARRAGAGDSAPLAPVSPPA
jgi:hypothetical protein